MNILYKRVLFEFIIHPVSTPTDWIRLMDLPSRVFKHTDSNWDFLFYSNNVGKRGYVTTVGFQHTKLLLPKLNDE